MTKLKTNSKNSSNIDDFMLRVKKKEKTTLMKIGICPSSKKIPAKNFVFPIMDYLHKNNIEVFIDDELKDNFSLPVIEDSSEIDIFITLGGDGTLLYFMNKYANHKNALFTAVNFGSLGFMADIRIEEFEGYLNDLINKRYEVHKRVMVDAISPAKDLHSAVNDVVLHRGNIKSMVGLEVKIDGLYFNTFQSDGLIISTPTGSTAYSLASGGPIVDPSLNAFIITPICPHTLTTRPFVIQDSSVIEITSISESNPITITMDGLSSFELNPNETMTVKLSSRSFNLISFPEKDNSFYSILRKKLGWKGSNSYGR
ncbi:MAG: NAD kinase [Chlamydiia bacterium]|nr:NAD kinase [Chlamydiia bacterium]